MKRILPIAVIIIVMIGIMYFATMNDVGMFIRLRAWDKGAPGRSVTSFLEAAKQGNAQEASQYIDTGTYKDLKEGDKTVGYFVTTQAGTMSFPFNDLAPDGNVEIKETNFVLLGEGAADVVVKGKGDEDGRYRLKLVNGKWVIMEIRSGGRMSTPAPPPGKGQAPAPPRGG